MQIDFARFTDNARAATKKAQQISQECGYQYIEPQVMMIAIIQERKDMFFFLVQNMGVDRISFCQAVGASVAEIPQVAPGSPALSQQLQDVLYNSTILADRTSCPLVSLEHIFGAFFFTDNPVRDIMIEHGITEEGLISSIIAYRTGSIANNNTLADTNLPELTALNKYSRNLSALAEEDKIEPVIGRDIEIRRILQILSRKTKNNPMLVGNPGTGKTAIVEGLARRLFRRDVPAELMGLRLFSLDMAALVAGTSQHGEFEERLKAVINEVKSDPNIILFIDEIHLLIGNGGSMDAANILKPELARGEIKIIGATTHEEYTKYIESDKAFERRFQKIVVDEPDIDTAITILRGIKSRFESFHRIKILDEAIVAAVKLSARYISDRCLPDKAIDLLDEAASRMRIERSSIPAEIDDLSRMIRSKEMERESLRQDSVSHDLSLLDAEIANLREKENDLNAKWVNERARFDSLQSLQDKMTHLKANFESEELSGHYEQAVSLQNEMDRLQMEIDSLVVEISESDNPLLKDSLDENDIRKVVTLWTGIPVNKLSDDESERLLHIEDELKQRIIGQDAAVSAVSKVIRRNKMGFGDPGRPIGSFLFLGTTGVGKTELAKALAEYLFNSQDQMVRIDMSEYQQEFSVSRLFGAPPGYVGYDQGGQLTEAVRRKPYSVILLDEIEKAHEKVFETLLQVLDDGRMTDGQGRVVDFKNTIVIMTSNMGAAALTDILVGAQCDQNSIDVAKQHVVALLKEKVAPEFINRIDEIVMFLPLGQDEIISITDLQLKHLCQKMSNRGIKLAYDQDIVQYIASVGYAPEYGARPIKRAINEYFVNGLTMSLLSGDVSNESTIFVKCLGNHLSFTN